MARKIGAGVLEIFHHTTASIAVATAPTAAELNAGTELTGFLADGGLATPLDGSIVDAADMGDRFNKTAAGTFGGQALTAEFFREFPTDTAWDALPRETDGYFSIIRRGLAAPGTFAVADEIDLWTIEVVSRNPLDVARNEMQRFAIECAVPAVPLEDFAIAA